MCYYCIVALDTVLCIYKKNLFTKSGGLYRVLRSDVVAEHIEKFLSIADECYRNIICNMRTARGQCMHSHCDTRSVVFVLVLSVWHAYVIGT